MKIVRNKIIPFKGFLAMCVWPFLFVRSDMRELSIYEYNHEKIHGDQQIEVMAMVYFLVILGLMANVITPWWVIAIPFVYFAFYGLEFAVRWVLYGFDSKVAYRNISFEQEAYLNQNDLAYQSKRKIFSAFKYLFKKTYQKNA